MKRDENEWLAKRFEQNRTHLRRIAYRMLGSVSEADDAVQEAWLRLSRSNSDGVENLGGWLTTVVGRVCLDMLRSRRSRREETLEEQTSSEIDPGPEANALLAESIAPALWVLLDTLTPAERVAFVMHDLFDLPFNEIGAIIGRSEMATRQLASRARRRVRGADAEESADRARQRRVVDAFLEASRNGDVAALLSVLAPDVVLRADEVAVQTAAANRWGGVVLPNEARGAEAVAATFKGRARGAQRAIIDGDAGAVWVSERQLRSAFVFTVEGEQIVELAIVMEPAQLGDLDVVLLKD